MKKFIFIIIMGVVALAVQANETNENVLTLQQSWAKANYELKDDAQEEAFQQLLVLADLLTTKHPEQAELWIWKGITQSSFAGVKGGLGALSLAKKARKSFEKALSLDETALQGSAYTSLGVLFHKVPGWPLGFGDEDEAKVLLEKALKINESGIDPNYFYAEFLFDHKEYKAAQTYLTKALQAEPRLQRPLADKERRKEIHTLLARVNERISSN